MGKYDFDLELVHQNSLLLILEQIRTHSIVLEFGPANGRLTKYLKEELHCEVYLVELDEAAGKEALQYGKALVTGDIETFEWFEKYRNVRFDYLIFADVLEHLKNPLKVLIQAKLLLKEDGNVLLSVPNLAHNAVLINLLNNEFQYNPIGLLDNTHIHMFTKTSLETMLADAGLIPVKRMATYAKTECTEIPADLNAVHGISAEFWKSRPYGEIYQFIFAAQKEGAPLSIVENDLISDTAGVYCQVFWSCGSDYSEDLSRKIRFFLDGDEKEFSFKCINGCQKIRIDPLENGGLFRLISCEGNGPEGWIPLVPQKHNARNVFGNVYYFDTADPQWHFDNTEGFSDIRVRISYLFTGQLEWLETVFDEETEARRKLEMEVASVRKENIALSEQLKIAVKEQEERVANLKDQYETASTQIKSITQELESLKMENTMYQKKIAEQLLLQQSLKKDYEHLQIEYESLTQKVGREYDV